MPFRAIVGHRKLLSLLSRAIAQHTLPPSLLLAGPAGIGKRRIAMAIAETINCLQPRGGDDLEMDACGECAACRRIARASHPDVIVVEPGETGSIKIEEIRDVIDRSGYRPFEGRRRAVIVDEADAMMAPAQSALLKTLEEPPSASTFILISSMPDAILPTVRSRCSTLRVAPLSPADTARVLVRDHEYGEADARAAAADAGGSVGVALAARSVDAADAREVARRLLDQAARIADPSRRLELAKDFFSPGARGAQAPRGGLASERDRLAASLRILASLLRDTGLLAARADAGALANADLEADLGRLAQAFDSERSQRAFMAVDRALGALERNVSPKVVADWLVLQL